DVALRAVGEDSDGASSTMCQCGDECALTSMNHVFAAHPLALLAAPAPVLVVGEEVPGVARSQDVLEDAGGQGIGVHGAEGRHDRCGQYGAEPVPAEEHGRHP